MRIAKLVMLACQVGLTGADAQCSESLGNCAKPRASLMQLKTLKQKQQFQTTFSSQLASFQKFTDEMIAKYGADNSSDPFTEPTIQSAVKTVLQFIDTMYESLLTYHQADVTAAANCATVGQHCEGVHLGPNKTADINAKNATANSKHTEFLTCMDERATACGIENKYCDRYDEYRQQAQGYQGTWVRGDGSEPQYLPSCVVDGEFGETYIKAGVGTPMLAAMEACLEKTNSWLNGITPPPNPEADGFVESTIPVKYDGLYPHYENCDRTTDECGGYHTTCKDKQTAFETSYCLYEMWWDGECGAWKHCTESGLADCSAADGTCANIAINVQGRKADNETGMRLKCLLQVLFGEFDSEAGTFGARLPGAERANALTACTSATYNTDMWDITCGTGSNTYIPAICSVTCPADPGTGAFSSAYYSGLGSVVTIPHTESNGVNKDYWASQSACAIQGQHQYNCMSTIDPVS